MKTERFEMRIDPETLKRVDGWRTEQSDLPSRAEAMRRLVDVGLVVSGKGEPRITDGERLILLLLLDLYKHQQVSADFNPDFLDNAIYGGHYWALELEYPGLFHRHVDNAAVVSEVMQILSMWVTIERGYASLSQTDKDRVKGDADPFGDRVKFFGFYANEEIDHLTVTNFLVNKMDRFTQFKGRELDSHIPTVEAYRRMLPVFQQIQSTVLGRELSASHIIRVLKEMTHPDNR